MQEHSYKKLSIVSLAFSAICLGAGAYVAGVSADESYYGAYPWHHLVIWGTLSLFILCLLWTVIVFWKDRK